jgi:hypothetical protein
MVTAVFLVQDVSELRKPLVINSIFLVHTVYNNSGFNFLEYFFLQNARLPIRKLSYLCLFYRISSNILQLLIKI